jgi:hypothetical protein
MNNYFIFFILLIYLILIHAELIIRDLRNVFLNNLRDIYLFFVFLFCFIFINY